MPTVRPAALAANVFVLLVVALLPLVYNDQYILSLIVTAFILIILNSSWNLLLGMAGVWNFGQLALYAAGGYGAGLLMLHSSIPAGAALVAGGATGAVLAAVLAFPTLRLFGIYTSLLTFSFAEVIQFVILNDNSGTTGGPFGLPYVAGLFPSLGATASMRAYYWTSLAIVVLVLIALVFIMRSRFGLGLRALRDSLPYAAARGLSPLRYRVAAFGISGFIAGVAGGLYTDFNGTIQPDVMGLTPMSIYVTMLVIGGLGTITGPVIGTALLVVIETLLVDHPAIELTILGIVLLVIVVFFPRGIVGEFSSLGRRFSSWLSEGEEAEVEPDAEPGADAPEGGRSVAGAPAQDTEATA